VKIPGRKFNSNKKVVFNVGGEDYVQRNVYSYGSPLNSLIAALVPHDQSTNPGGEPGMRQGNFSQAELANYLGVDEASITAHCTASDTTPQSLTQYFHVCAEPYTTTEPSAPLAPPAVNSSTAPRVSTRAPRLC